MSGPYVLAIDHRNSFRLWHRALFGARPDELEVLADAKLAVAEGLVEALGRGVTAEEAALLVDAEYGEAAAGLARRNGVRVVVPVERSGQPEFLFEHGERFAEHLGDLSPGLVKALVRYNPDGEVARNERSRMRLGVLQGELAGRGLPWMLELLVPAEPAQLEAVGEDRLRYDDHLRPGLTLRAIDELSSSGLRPRYWKLEGQPDVAACRQVAERVRRLDPESSCLVLGRGEDRRAVERWLTLAAAVEGFSGFAVGRTIWEQPLAAMRSGAASRPEAVAAIAAGYLALVEVFRSGRGSAAAAQGTATAAGGTP